MKYLLVILLSITLEINSQYLFIDYNFNQSTVYTFIDYNHYISWYNESAYTSYPIQYYYYNNYNYYCCSSTIPEFTLDSTSLYYLLHISDIIDSILWKLNQQDINQCKLKNMNKLFNEWNALIAAKNDIVTIDKTEFIVDTILDPLNEKTKKMRFFFFSRILISELPKEIKISN